MLVEECDKCGKEIFDSPHGWCPECFKQIREEARASLIWKNIFDGPWRRTNSFTRKINILGIRHPVLIIEEWWNYRTRETKIITHKWENENWETNVSSK